MRRRPRDWEVVVTFGGNVVERRIGMTRFGARMEASGLNSTFARGMPVLTRGGPFTAPTYDTSGMPYASARPTSGGSDPTEYGKAT